MNAREIARLLVQLKIDISDEYRASDDPDDNTPGMVVTFATDAKETDWAYQTGDNSYSGGCYFYPFWSVVYLYRDSNCRELARQVVNELRNQIAESTS